MTKTVNLSLPLVQPAQAQKHVTVNEALTRLDAVAQLRVVSDSIGEPPENEAEGACYIVPDSANGAWSGRSREVAVRSNGGWIFVAPKFGWRAANSANSTHLVFDGVSWINGAAAISAGGAATVHQIIDFDHEISPGSANTTTVEIPAQSQVTGISGRVQQTVSGPGLTGWRIGVAGSEDRYGAGLGRAVNSHVLGLTGVPVTYFEPAPLLLSAEGGSFLSGEVRLAIHLTRLITPRQFSG